MTNETFHVTRVSATGRPESPPRAKKAFSNTIGCIVREHVRITSQDIRRLERTQHDLLFQKLFDRFVIPEADKERVRRKAESIMSTSLKTWRYDANKLIDADFETKIKTKWPKIELDQWEEFVAERRTEGFQQKSTKFKELRSKNKYDHRLGSGGYEGKEPAWDAEDAKKRAEGKPLPFEDITERRARNYVRARTSTDPETGAPVFHNPEVQQVSERLVSLYSMSFRTSFVHMSLAAYHKYTRPLLCRYNCPSNLKARRTLSKARGGTPISRRPWARRRKLGEFEASV